MVLENIKSRSASNCENSLFLLNNNLKIIKTNKEQKV